MELPILSEEQKNIVDNINENNIIVDSVAGSGKTTTNLHIAKRYNNYKILLMTYNSKLKLETREKVNLYGLNNLEVHSYHSFCVKYYNRNCFTDTTIKKILKEKTNPLKHFNYDLIVLDEAQDIRDLYYELVCKIYKDNNNNKTNICIFGDRRQSIYEFNTADSRYIVYADKLFNFNNKNSKRCNLSTSFRITNTMATFINKCVLKEDILKANKITNIKPRYIICDTFDDNKYKTTRTFKEVEYYLSLGYLPEEIFIIAPSLKSDKSPVRQLENLIKKNLTNINIFVPISDDEKLEEDILIGKLVFSTFHQVKGLERKVVIVFNFDQSYFAYYKKDANPNYCPNELYVAITRAKEYLTLFHHDTNDYLPFINNKKIDKYTYFENNLKFHEHQEDKKITNKSVTELIRFLPDTIIDTCLEYISIIENTDFQTNIIKIPNKTKNTETNENISEINGLFIPALFEYKLKKEITIIKMFKHFDYTSKIQQYNILNFDFNNINIHLLNISELLYICNCWLACNNGYLFKICQIKKYDWLTDEVIINCLLQMSKLNISKNSSFEFGLLIDNEIELLEYSIQASFDCLDIENNILYEFKCTNEINKSHLLQLAIYMYMYEIYKYKLNKKEKTKYVLYNIYNNKYYELNSDFNKLKEMMKYLIYEKFINKKKITDQEFIQKNIKIYNNYII